MRLIDDWESNSCDFIAQGVHILVEQFEVQEFREVEDHLFHAEFVEELAPVEACRVVVFNIVFFYILEFMLVSQTFDFILELIVVPDVPFGDSLVVSHIGNFCGRNTFSVGGNLSVDPRELFLACLLPERIRSISKLLAALVVFGEGAGLHLDEFGGLVLHVRQLVHVLTAAVVSLILGVLNGFAKSGSQSVRVRTINTEMFVILVKVFYTGD